MRGVRAAVSGPKRAEHPAGGRLAFVFLLLVSSMAVSVRRQTIKWWWSTFFVSNLKTNNKNQSQTNDS